MGEQLDQDLKQTIDEVSIVNETVEKVKEEAEYVEMTDEQLKKLVLAAREGAVFGTWNVPEHDQDMIRHIFMPLIFMDKPDFFVMRTRKVAHLYEYVEKAGPRSINGYPIFWSFSTMTESEFERFKEMWKKIEKALKEV